MKLTPTARKMKVRRSTVATHLKRLHQTQVSNNYVHAYFRALSSLMSSCRCCRQVSLNYTKLSNRILKHLCSYCSVAECPLEVELDMAKEVCQLDMELLMVVNRELSELLRRKWKQSSACRLWVSHREERPRLILPAIKTKISPLTFCLNLSPRRKNLSFKKELLNQQVSRLKLNQLSNSLLSNNLHNNSLLNSNLLNNSNSRQTMMLTKTTMGTTLTTMAAGKIPQGMQVRAETTKHRLSSEQKNEHSQDVQVHKL